MYFHVIRSQHVFFNMFLRFIHANIYLYIYIYMKYTHIFEPSFKRKKGDKNTGSVWTAYRIYPLEKLLEILF